MSITIASPIVSVQITTPHLRSALPQLVPVLSHALFKALTVAVGRTCASVPRYWPLEPGMGKNGICRKPTARLSDLENHRLLRPRQPPTQSQIFTRDQPLVHGATRQLHFDNALFRPPAITIHTRQPIFPMTGGTPLLHSQR